MKKFLFIFFLIISNPVYANCCHLELLDYRWYDGFFHADYDCTFCPYTEISLSNVKYYKYNSQPENYIGNMSPSVLYERKYSLPASTVDSFDFCVLYVEATVSFKNGGIPVSEEISSSAPMDYNPICYLKPYYGYDLGNGYTDLWFVLTSFDGVLSKYDHSGRFEVESNNTWVPVAGLEDVSYGNIAHDILQCGRKYRYVTSYPYYNHHYNQLEGYREAISDTIQTKEFGVLEIILDDTYPFNFDYDYYFYYDMGFAPLPDPIPVYDYYSWIGLWSTDTGQYLIGDIYYSSNGSNYDLVASSVELNYERLEKLPAGNYRFDIYYENQVYPVYFNLKYSCKFGLKGDGHYHKDGKRVENIRSHKGYGGYERIQ